MLLPLEVGKLSVFTRVDTIVHVTELAPFLLCDYQLIAGACLILLVLTTVKILTFIIWVDDLLWYLGFYPCIKSWS